MSKNGIVRVLAILTIFSILSGCTRQQALKRYSADFLELFDTMSRVVGYARSEEEFKEQSAFVYERLKFYHQQFDFFRSYDGVNNIKTVNDQAGIAPVSVDPCIIDLLDFCIQSEKDTGGAVNVAMGSVLQLWHRQREEYMYDEENAALPPMELLQEAAEHTDISKLIIDRENGTVYLADKKMRLDVGAIAKGYALQRVADEAKEKGIRSMIISVGGNVVAIGTKPRDEKWSVGIQNLYDEEGEVTPSVKLKDRSLVSSGDYERFFVADGVRYGHIIDPKTLMPPTKYRQVSVLAKDSGEGDVLSTALFILDIEEGKKLLRQYHAEAVWILADGRIIYSDQFRDYEKN